MAITLRLPAGGTRDVVGFAYSPALEATLSLRPIVEPKRHPQHLAWSRRARELDDDLRDEIHRLRFAFATILPGLFEVGLAGDFPTIEDELHRIVEFDDDAALYELTLAFQDYPCGGALHDPAVIHDATFQEQVLTAARERDPEAGAILEAAFADPATVRVRLATMLQRYWEALFQDEWSRIEPRLDAEVTTGARLLVTAGLDAMLAHLVPEARFDPATPAILVDKPWDREVDVAGRGGLSLVPTVFGWPKLMVEADDPWAVAIIHPLTELRQTAVPLASDRQVADGLRALGDETRLQIARLVAEEPRSTKELAQLLSLSESAVSRHLKLLAAAEVVTSERDGYFVLYALRRERIGQLGGALRRTLGLAPAPASSGTAGSLEVVGPRPLEPPTVADGDPVTGVLRR